MNPNDYSHWRNVIDDFAADRFRTATLAAWRVERGRCEACDHLLSPMSYEVYVEPPGLTDDWGPQWHFFGDICWDCMLTIVSAGGHALPWSPNDNAVSETELEKRMNQWLRERFGEEA